MLYRIQILRFVAALAVLNHHAIDVVASYKFDVYLFNFLKGWGSGGVELFFVISGFILFRICLEQRPSPISFMRDRILRIVPMYWLCTIGMSAGLIIFSSFLRSENFDPELLLYSLFFVSQIMGFQFPTLGVGWTLEYEFQFYVVLSVVIFAGLIEKSIIIAFIIIILLFISGLDFTLYISFVFGMIIAQLNFKSIFCPKPILATFIGIVLFFSGIFFKDELDRFFIYSIPSLILVYALTSLDRGQRSVFSYLGDCSYSLYLTHQPLLPVIAKIAVIFFPSINGDVLIFGSMIILILFSVIVYQIFERPLLKILKKFKARNEKINL